MAALPGEARHVGPEDGGRNSGPPTPGAEARPELGVRGGGIGSLRMSRRLRDAKARHFRADCNDACARHGVQLRSGSSLLGGGPIGAEARAAGAVARQ